jgi:hypothetical protein
MTHTGFDLPLATVCASLSEDAYEDNPKLGYILRAGNAEVLVWTYSDMVVFAFRGTQVTSGWSWEDVLDNILMDLLGVGLSNTYKVHEGYLGYFRHLEPIIRDVIRKNPGKKVIFTGHSLGGAVAAVAGLIVGCYACYTFGAPKSGDGSFRSAWRKRTANLYRVVHACDIAPKHPRELFGYRHAGELWRISRSGRLRQSRTQFTDFLPFPVALGILDHRVGEYKTKLQRSQLT